ncbi:MAG: phospholipase [Gemmatimonadota bacterium]|nr:phospholipase [Gemmatimonadota bacterium]
MMEAQERHIEVPKTARYWVLGETEGSPDEVWCVLHGYRQLAGRFIRRFQGIGGGGRRIVAPEALSRFYVGRQPGRHGPESVVGGTWMTREERENEIRDYVRYLDLLYDEVGVAGAATTVLGFSQGVAAAARWVTYGAVRPQRLILWGDYVPPDLDMAKARAALADTELLIVRGTEDPALNETLRAQEQERLEASRIAYRLVSYDGGHDIHAETLAQLATR